MKKILALILTGLLLLGCVSAQATETGKYEQLTVGVTTPFSGNFLADTLGNNISDQDVRKLIHGYSLVYWDSGTGSYQFDRSIISAATISTDGLTYTFALAQGLTFNDGTPITARDYAFALLLLGSDEMEQAMGQRDDLSRIKGGSEYGKGLSDTLAGFRILSDHQFSITMDESFSPYFYQLKALDFYPLPISVIAPGCEVKDNGDGAFISGAFSAELLRKTMSNPETGYVSHPFMTCGPYQLSVYDGDSVSLIRNEQYLGNNKGVQPDIPRIVIRVETPDALIQDLAAGEIDLAVRCAREETIRAGMMLTVGGDFAMKTYSRAGLSFISFCAEKGPTADVNVREAIAMCLDKQTLTEQYLGAFGTTVKGYYGIGQWMFLKANGMLLPSEGEEEGWVDLTMDQIQDHELDTAAAERLLEAAGWDLNEQGGFYETGDGVRCKMEGNTLVPLRLRLIYPEGNGAGALLEETFTSYLKEIGIALEVAEIPMTELLQRYYGQTERDCDMILLGTNFGDVFDPSGEYDENGTSRLNGVTDLNLAALAEAMRNTEPGNATEYCRRWLAYLARRSALVTEIPIYSDAYVDFHISALQGYQPGSTGNWTLAIQEAMLSDVAEEPDEGLEDEFLD